jgi:hypothetical protein
MQESGASEKAGGRPEQQVSGVPIHWRETPGWSGFHRGLRLNADLALSEENSERGERAHSQNDHCRRGQGHEPVRAMEHRPRRRLASVTAAGLSGGAFASSLWLM